MIIPFSLRALAFFFLVAPTCSFGSNLRGQQQQRSMSISTSLVGKYNLTSVIDANGNSVNLPKHYAVSIQSYERTYINDAGEEVVTPSQDVMYNFYIKVGNSLSSVVTFSQNDTTPSTKQAVSFSGVRSTMMMPPQDVYKVEIALSVIIPTIDTLEITEDGNLLWKSGAASLTCVPASK